MKIKSLAATAAAALLLAALTACSPGITAKPDTAKPEPVASTVESEAPAEIVAEEGSLEKPYPVGYAVTIYQGSPDNVLATVTAAIKDPNANAAIAQANQFNDPAQTGYHYVAVEYTMTGASKTEPASMSFLLYDWSLAQNDGVLIGESNTSVVMPDGWNQTYSVNDLYEGQTGAGVVIYQVPDAYTGPLLVTAYGKYLSL